MRPLLVLFDLACRHLMYGGLFVVVVINQLRLAVPRRVRRWQGSLRKAIRRLFGEPEVPAFIRVRAAHNRTPDYIEEAVVRLHVETRVGPGQLRLLTERVLGFRAARETFRKILIRRKDLIIKLEDERKRRPRSIRIGRPRELWGVDLTLVWVLGIIPVHVLGVVDLYGSRVVALERVAPPTASRVAAALERAFERHGAPERVLTDNGPQFVGIDFELMLCRRGVEHTLTRKAHPWTNGRIERLFRTFKEAIFAGRWLLASTWQLDRFCAEFVTFYNRDRPHNANGGRTPDEIYFRLPMQRAPIGRVRYFDGALTWYRFG